MARQGNNMTGDVATAEKQCKNWRGRHFWENSQEKQAQAFFGTRKRHEKERKQKLNDIGSRPPINPVVEALPRPPPKKNLPALSACAEKKTSCAGPRHQPYPFFFVVSFLVPAAFLASFWGKRSQWREGPPENESLSNKRLFYENVLLRTKHARKPHRKNIPEMHLYGSMGDARGRFCLLRKTMPNWKKNVWYQGWERNMFFYYCYYFFSPKKTCFF